MMPAQSRRPTIPTTLSTATPRIARAAAASAPVVVRPSRNAGRITRAVTWPITKALAMVMAPKSALPVTASANIRHCSRMPAPSTYRPRTNTSVGVRVTRTAYRR
jgi:hypothetical protein